MHGNVLIGTIPKEIGLLKNLKVLDLGSNQLIGPIPLELGNLSNIIKMLVQFLSVCCCMYTFLYGFHNVPLSRLALLCLCRNLQSNGLTGKLPSELGKLTYLQELRLDRNKLKGTLPASSGSNFTTKVYGM